MNKNTCATFTCPNCHSNQIQSYELIYAQNVLTGTHSTTLSNGEVATTGSVFTTALGEVVAPPAMKSGVSSIIETMLDFFIVGPLILVSDTSKSEIFLVLALIAFFGIMYYCRKSRKDAKKWNEEVYPKLYEDWQHSYMCMKCGYKFQI